MEDKIHSLLITVDGNQEADKIIGSLMKNERVLEIVNDKKGIIKGSPSTSVKIYFEHAGVRSEKISRLLTKLGLAPHHSGFHYLQSAIEHCLTLDIPQFCVTKDIYPYVAGRFNSTVERVERCIRKSLDYSWSNGGSQLFEDTTGLKLQRRPTNAQFISFVTEYIRSNRERFYS